MVKANNTSRVWLGGILFFVFMLLSLTPPIASFVGVTNIVTRPWSDTGYMSMIYYVVIAVSAGLTAYAMYANWPGFKPKCDDTDQTPVDAIIALAKAVEESFLKKRKDETGKEASDDDKKDAKFEYRKAIVALSIILMKKGDTCDLWLGTGVESNTEDGKKLSDLKSSAQCALKD